MDSKGKQRIGELLLKIAECDKAVDEGAIEELFCIMAERLYSVAFKYLHNQEDAEDTVTEVFCDIRRISDKYIRGMNGDAFLCVITRNRALDALKSRKRRESHVVIVSPEELKQIAERHEASVDISEALTLLNEEEYEAIYAVYWYGYSIREAAKLLNKSKSTLQRIVDRAKVKIQSKLK